MARKEKKSMRRQAGLGMSQDLTGRADKAAQDMVMAGKIGWAGGASRISRTGRIYRTSKIGRTGMERQNRIGW
jgi:hypothetical protein